MKEQEINDVLAEKAMQWTPNDKFQLFGGGVTEEVWFDKGKFIKFKKEWIPTTSLTQAWSAAEKMLSYTNGPERFVVSAEKGIYGCIFVSFSDPDTVTGGFTIDEPTPEMAICKAILNELGIEIKIGG